MKDGRFENADELRVWLDRTPPPKPAPQPSPTEVICDDGTWLARCLPCAWVMRAITASQEGAQSLAAHHDTYRHSGTNPSCPKCHGAGHYIEECKTPGWRMVDCECSK